MRILFLSMVLMILVACNQEMDIINGYVEGEYLYIAPTTEGILKDLFVQRGQQVEIAQDLFALDDTKLNSRLASVKAEVLQAEARWNNLTKGSRPEEIDIILKQQEQARATFKNAEEDLRRAQALVKTNVISRSTFDDRKTKFETAKARVEELAAQLKIATLGARKDEIIAAKAVVAMAKQKLIQAEKALQEAAPKAPSAGKIENTYFRPGEFVAVGAPVVSLLPPENVKVRFFVSQHKLPQMSLGRAVNITCDGCTKPIPAKVTFISSQAEFTPPVIYSLESRDKLVFMIEATPDNFDPSLHPGLPVNIVLLAP